MAKQRVNFIFFTGINRKLFTKPRLSGSWGANGLYSNNWTNSEMETVVGEDGCPAFRGYADLDLAAAGETFKWGVTMDGPAGPNLWGINTEVNDSGTVTDRYGTFTLAAGLGVQQFYFNYKRRLGANRVFVDGDVAAKLRFSVWSPNAISIHVVFGGANGYIDDAGNGIDAAMPVIPLAKGDGDIWDSALLDDFSSYESKYYMYRVESAQGDITYKTDIFSRALVGRGPVDPAKDHWDGTIGQLDGTVSCSVVVDPDKIIAGLPSAAGPQPPVESPAEFWKDEFDPDKPVPVSIDDMVIYELHIGALGNQPGVPGTLADAVALLPQLVRVGINAIELLPMSEFFGDVNWGYGETHHLVIQTSAGGRDAYRYFIRECHKLGIAVIQDVVYNHYSYDSDRAEWQYDSNVNADNFYFWYVGKDADYANPGDGYLDNQSTGPTPNFKETLVRQQFISAGAFMLDDLHVDGFRMDLTQAIHSFNVLAGNHSISVGEANEFGAKFLREWGRTMRMIRPKVMLMAEDYSNWPTVTDPVTAGGFGFNAVWYADFFHSLIGYDQNAMVLLNAGFGDNRPLGMDALAGTLFNSQFNKVVFHCNHDNAGNCLDPYHNIWSHRTMLTAVNCAPMVGDTRRYAEARSRVMFGLSVLSAGTPLFFMGEEIAAMKPYTYDHFVDFPEDIIGDSTGIGACMFLCYQDLLKVNQRYASVRSKNIDVLFYDNTERLIIFKRWSGTEQVLVAASLNNSLLAYFTLQSDAYRLPDGGYKEIFNSDAVCYGGNGIGNYGTVLNAVNGSLTLTIPANGVLVFVKVS